MLNWLRVVTKVNCSGMKSVAGRLCEICNVFVTTLCPADEQVFHLKCLQWIEVCVKKKWGKHFTTYFVYETFYYLYLLLFSLNASDVSRPLSVRKFSVKTNLVKRSSHGLTNTESQPCLHYNYSIALQHHFLPYCWSCSSCSPTQQSQP